MAITQQSSTGAVATVYAQKNTAQSAVTGDGTLVTIIWDNEIVDPTGSYDPVTGIFTALTAGDYWYSTTFRLDGLIAVNTTGFIKITGSTFGTETFYLNPYIISDNTVASFSFSKIIKCALNETVITQIQVNNNATKNVNINGDVNYPDGWISIFKIA